VKARSGRRIDLSLRIATQPGTGRMGELADLQDRVNERPKSVRGLTIFAAGCA
jgi:hypothetical protein